MTLNFRLSDIVPEMHRAMREMSRPIAEAATLAARDTAAVLLSEGRADIAAAGFGRKWQNALRVTVYPSSGVSIDAAVWLYHRFRYAHIHEEGATIAGRPLLWLRLPDAPATISRRRFTPSTAAAAGIKLVSFKSRSGTPLLGARMRSSKASGKVSIAALRRGGTTGRGMTRTVPLFVGIRTAQMPQRFHIGQIAERARDRLPILYATHLKA